MNWTKEQIELSKTAEPDRYKCHICHIVIKKEHLEEDGNCPKCHTNKGLKSMCPLDHCNCHHNVIEKIEYCPVCGEPICPECGSHDVSQVSRVTGYLADVKGWNQGKQQELKDRSRYRVA